MDTTRRAQGGATGASVPVSTVDVRAGTDAPADPDIDVLAQRVVDAVTGVTDFAVAMLTVREGGACRRIAAAGLPDARLGLRTDYDRWAQLLLEEHRRGACFLLPPRSPTPTGPGSCRCPSPRCRPTAGSRGPPSTGSWSSWWSTTVSALGSSRSTRPGRGCCPRTPPCGSSSCSPARCSWPCTTRVCTARSCGSATPPRRCGPSVPRSPGASTSMRCCSTAVRRSSATRSATARASTSSTSRRADSALS